MEETKGRPVIGITMGDPVGIGPEIVIKALEAGEIYGLCRPLVLGDLGRLRTTGEVLGSRLAFNPVSGPSDGAYRRGTMDVLAVSCLAPDRITWGQPTPETGRAMVSYIERAVELALAGQLAGIATCPINKKAMAGAGVDFPGHTELLARRTGARRVVMMLAGPRLRVVLVTVHMALSRVPRVLSQQDILETIEITDRSLRERFGLASPRLAVAGLNPHAGEEGLFGDEEGRLIRPAVEAARLVGINAVGPFPPDTVFYQAAAGHYDAVVCMYHDQGLIPFKLLHFDEGVNTTLGLPIIRTSVDHGTAYDIAGTGRADPRSLVAAIRMAAEQAGHLGI
jgi:4-hydroxythreonine-4-phosphate dehydrogenase